MRPARSTPSPDRSFAEVSPCPPRSILISVLFAFIGPGCASSTPSLFQDLEKRENVAVGLRGIPLDTIEPIAFADDRDFTLGEKIDGVVQVGPGMKFGIGRSYYKVFRWTPGSSNALKVCSRGGKPFGFGETRQIFPRVYFAAGDSQPITSRWEDGAAPDGGSAYCVTYGIPDFRGIRDRTFIVFSDNRRAGKLFPPSMRGGGAENRVSPVGVFRLVPVTLKKKRR